MEQADLAWEREREGVEPELGCDGDSNGYATDVLPGHNWSWQRRRRIPAFRAQRDSRASASCPDTVCGTSRAGRCTPPSSSPFCRLTDNSVHSALSCSWWRRWKAPPLLFLLLCGALLTVFVSFNTLSLALIRALLFIAGVEQNPGPPRAAKRSAEQHTSDAHPLAPEPRRIACPKCGRATPPSTIAKYGHCYQICQQSLASPAPAPAPAPSVHGALMEGHDFHSAGCDFGGDLEGFDEPVVAQPFLPADAEPSSGAAFAATPAPALLSPHPSDGAPPAATTAQLPGPEVEGAILQSPEQAAAGAGDAQALAPPHSPMGAGGAEDEVVSDEDGVWAAAAAIVAEEDAGAGADDDWWEDAGEEQAGEPPGADSDDDDDDDGVAQLVQEMQEQGYGTEPEESDPPGGDGAPPAPAAGEGEGNGGEAVTPPDSPRSGDAPSSPLRGPAPKRWCKRGPYALHPYTTETVLAYCCRMAAIKIEGRIPLVIFERMLEAVALTGPPGHLYPSTMQQVNYVLGLHRVTHHLCLVYACCGPVDSSGERVPTEGCRIFEAGVDVCPSCNTSRYVRT